MTLWEILQLMPGTRMSGLLVKTKVWRSIRIFLVRSIDSKYSLCSRFDMLKDSTHDLCYCFDTSRTFLNSVTFVANSRESFTDFLQLQRSQFNWRGFNEWNKLRTRYLPFICYAVGGVLYAIASSRVAVIYVNFKTIMSTIILFGAIRWWTWTNEIEREMGCYPIHFRWHFVNALSLELIRDRNWMWIHLKWKRKSESEKFWPIFHRFFSQKNFTSGKFSCKIIRKISRKSVLNGREF